MTAPQRKETYFPELDGEEQREADEWLRNYLRLVIRIHSDNVEKDGAALSTARALTGPAVQAGSVRSIERSVTTE